MIVNVQEFRDDDSGYVNWSTEHDRGYVINIQRTLHPGEARLHRADCRSISGTNPRLGPWTGAYIKVCADEVANLDAWALAHNLGAIRRCSICHPAGETFPPRSKLLCCRVGAQRVCIHVTRYFSVATIVRQCETMKRSATPDSEEASLCILYRYSFFCSSMC